MKLLTPNRKVSFGLVVLTISLLLVGDMIGVVPHDDRGLMDGRKKFCESLAVQFSLAASRDNLDLIKDTLIALVERDPDVLSAAVRNRYDRLLIKAGDHTQHWVDVPESESTYTHVQVPIFQNNKHWGTVEVAFENIQGFGSVLGLNLSLLPLILFLALAGFFAYSFFIKRTLRELDPSSVIPERVKSAFDALSEGLVVMDEKAQIILANSSFVDKLELAGESLLGRKVSKLGWNHSGGKKGKERLPWETALTDKERQIGVPLKYDLKHQKSLTFMVNATPIKDAKDAVRGVLATFDDLTDLETKQIELKGTIGQLQKSRKELQDKTVELEYLATRDPLTACLNRRAFFEKSEFLFLYATQNNTELACIMADIDHFKAVNDNYGHATGDKVIKMVAGELTTHARPDDVVGRYGGEEFCIVLPGADSAEAVSVADRVRIQIQNSSKGRFASCSGITMSFGVASLSVDATTLSEMINQADKALYVAKESGRNRVVAWGDAQVAIDGEQQDAVENQDEPVPSAEGHHDADDLDENRERAGKGNADQDLQKLNKRIGELEAQLSYSLEKPDKESGRDQVTGLPNRLLFYDRVSQALSRGQRNDLFSAIVVINIDMFQRINDALGFVVGDKLLKKSAERLQVILRDTDMVVLLNDDESSTTLSRTSADEFAILLTDLKDTEMVTWIVKRILDSMSVSLEIEGHEIFISCSAGIALFPHDGDNADTLLRNANAARHSAKKRLGRNNFAFYSTDLNQESYKKLWFESQLHHALELGELYLNYQPKLDLNTGKITSMEALVRWKNEKLGFVSPVDFIPIAERTGLINEIGDWVLRTACYEAMNWEAAGFKGIRVAVNLSAAQFRQRNFHEKIIKIVEDVALEPSLLELEITESVLMENFDSAVETLNELTAAGMELALDDFGTGYSSLAYLKNLPLNTLKIDRSFLSDTVPDRQDETIITAIIAMAHSMELRIVAEGVETKPQRGFLHGLGCDEIQGYLISRPVDGEEALKLLHSYNGEDIDQGRVRKLA